MKTLFFTIFIVINISSYGQHSDVNSNKEDKALNFYKSLYKAADSLTTSGNAGKIAIETYKVADSLDALHPLYYFEKAMNYLSKSKFNDAAFLYFVGASRFAYFNSVNPNYEAGGDGALNTSLISIMAEPMGMYLNGNIDNYMLILKACQKYCTENDYKFYSKNKDIDKYNRQITNFSKQLSDLAANKQKYLKEWKKQRKEIENMTPVIIDKERWDTDKSKWSPLMLAIYANEVKKYKNLLANNVDVNYITPDEKGSDMQLTALDVAIYVANEDAINALLKTNKISRLNESLMLACGFQKASTIELLIKAGADPNYTNKTSHTVGMVAAGSGSLEVLETLLKNGAAVNQTRGVGGMTMLMYATSKGSVEKVKLLLKYGADKYIKTKKGMTALNGVDKIYPRMNVSEETKNELRELLK